MAAFHPFELIFPVTERGYPVLLETMLSELLNSPVSRSVIPRGFYNSGPSDLRGVWVGFDVPSMFSWEFFEDERFNGVSKLVPYFDYHVGRFYVADLCQCLRACRTCHVQSLISVNAVALSDVDMEIPFWLSRQDMLSHVQRDGCPFSANLPSSQFVQAFSAGIWVPWRLSTAGVFLSVVRGRCLFFVCDPQIRFLRLYSKWQRGSRHTWFPRMARCVARRECLHEGECLWLPPGSVFGIYVLEPTLNVFSEIYPAVLAKSILQFWQQDVSRRHQERELPLCSGNCHCMVNRFPGIIGNLPSLIFHYVRLCTLRRQLPSPMHGADLAMALSVWSTDQEVVCNCAHLSTIIAALHFLGARVLAFNA